MTLHVMAVEIEDRLRRLRADVLRNMAGEERDLATAPEDRGEDTTPSQHPADVATDLLARETLVTADRGHQRLLQSIDAALARLRDGTYGVCVDCGEPIPRARLAALPHAARCVRCQRAIESRA